MRTRAALFVVPAAIAMALAAAGCERAMRDMYSQPRVRPMEPAPGGRSSLLRAPEGSIARDGPARVADAAPANPFAIGPALLQRGRERHDIYCAPCHGVDGAGEGVVAMRGFPHPPPYRDRRVVAATDRHLYDVIRDGYGIMYPHGDRVESPRDRWAIVAYVRALQRLPQTQSQSPSHSHSQAASQSPQTQSPQQPGMPARPDAGAPPGTTP